jgi:DNA-binding beta-propeller fold protein YncE
LLAIAWLGLVSIAVVPLPRATPILRQVTAFTLPRVKGRIDHMALDEAGQRLFVVALGNNSLEVLDVRSGKRLRSVTGFREPQGVGFLATPPRLFVANGGDGSISMLDARSFRTLRKIHVGEDADNVRVDAPGRRVYVGFGSGALALLDAATGDSLARLELPAHPEAFEIENGGSRIFVNVPDAGEVSVVDRARGQMTEHWRLGDVQANFPIAFYPAGKRLFIGCRRPAVLLVLDSATGKRLAAVPIDGDPDDLFFDARARKLYASCGAGFIDVLAVPDTGAPSMFRRVPTAPGARTSLFDEAQGRLYVAVPHRGTQAARVLVFEVAR